MPTTYTPEELGLHEIYPLAAKDLAESLTIERYLSQKDRDAIDSEDFAGPDRSFPIDTQAHLDAAAHLIGHAADPAAVKAKAIRIAKRKGFTLPESWKSDSDDEKDDRVAESDVERASNHDPFSGTHSHAHPAFGMDEHDSDHEHSHENDNDHDHHSHASKEADDEERANIPDTVFLHADIIRVDKNKREVTGVATSEAVDSFGTVFSYDASKAAFKRWIERHANVREMHQKKAVGKGIGVRFDDEDKKIYVTTRVSRSADGDNAWTKIEEGILNGFSVGAPSSSAVWETVTRGGKQYPYLTKYDLSELSLVDNASNPDAQGLVIARADGLVEEVVDITESDEQTPTSDLSSSPVSDVPVARPSDDLERAGARVSHASMGALHDARNTAMRSAKALMKHCGCDQCQRASSALDPDNDGDIDFMGMDDPDGDADSHMAERAQESDFTPVEAKIEETIERVFSSKITSFLQRQQSVLTRFASIDTDPEGPDQTFDPDIIRSVVSAEITNLVTPLEERLTTALERLDSSSSLSEVRDVLTSVKETVERIAEQPAPGGPVLNGGRPVEKRFANQPYTSNQPQVDPRTFWDMAQQQGLLTSPEAQMKAAAAMAIPIQSQR